MGQWERDLDHHITGNYGEDSVREYVCPKCGESSEDMEEIPVVGLDRTTVWKCECGTYSSDEGLMTLQTWIKENRPE
jgi:hypothetical protein